MIKAIIFDCFGVLKTDGWRLYREKNFSHDKTLFDRALLLDEQVNNKTINYQTFIAGVSAMTGDSPADIQKAFNVNLTNTNLFNYIERVLKPQYKIGMLSNAAEDWLDKLFTEPQVKLFDQIVLSYQVGFAKPDVRIYHEILTRLQVEPSEAVFIDDRQDFCDVAESLGFEAIHYTSYEEFVRDIDSLLRRLDKQR